MAKKILFKVEFIGDGFHDDVHVVAAGYDAAEAAALAYIRALPRQETDVAPEEIDESYITSIERVADDGQFGSLIIVPPLQAANGPLRVV